MTQQERMSERNGCHPATLPPCHRAAAAAAGDHFQCPALEMCNQHTWIWRAAAAAGGGGTPTAAGLQQNS
jgi:hypothetical protein